MIDRTGQFGVVSTKSRAAWFIKLGTRSQVNHAFVDVGGGFIIEAQPGGAVMTRARYPDAVWSQFDLTADQRAFIALQARRLRDTPYNFLDIACLALLSLGIRWQWLISRAQSDGSLICSQLVDRAYRNAGIHLYDDGRPDGMVTPGDLLMLLAEHSTRTELP